ncbi:MAG: hypothetical protein P8M16_01860 [Acidimicrobiales bacterium]|nr:hypothetical protein [Acidimicrobiales bacterium]
MKIWNRVFLMQPSRLGVASEALAAVHKEINSVSDYGYNLWETVIGTQGEFGVSALVSDIEAFTSGELMHDEFDGDKLGDLAGAVNECVDRRPEDSFWNVVHVLGDWTDTPAYVMNVVHETDMAQMQGTVGATVEFATYMHGVVEAPVIVCTSVFGTGPSVRMIWGYASLGDWEARTGRGMSDSGFQERLAAMSGPGVTLAAQSNVMRRLI